MIMDLREVRKLKLEKFFGRRKVLIFSLQVNVVRGSGRFVSTPPFPSYMYGRIMKRDEVSDGFVLSVSY